MEKQIIYKPNKNIPIVFITDNNFVMQTSVALVSLIKNRRNVNYDIFVIGADLSQENINIIQNIACYKQNITVIQADVNKIKNIHKYNVEGQGKYLSASEAALLKFDLPNILADYEKVIYLDGDVIVLNPLDGLYNTDLGSNYVAAAHDTGKLYFDSGYNRIFPNYFNSGVMLLNLELMRQHNLTDKLINTKKELNDSNLMDQNVLNIVFKDKIKIVDIRYNLLILNLERAKEKWNIEDINKLFNSSYTCFEEIKRQACVIHFSSKDKPWIYKDVSYAKDWYNYYKKTPFKNNKLVRVKRDNKNNVFLENIFSIKNNKDKTRKILQFLGLKIKIKRNKNSHLDINRSDTKNKKGIIVSMTSYPARINTVHLTIESLLNQTLKADKLILWLALEQFKNKENDLPKELLELQNKGLTIDWYHDIRSYKKLIPTLIKHPNDIIITVDDDVIYDKNCIKLLWKSHLKHKKTIICHRGHYILFDKKKNILPYSQWKSQYKKNNPSYNILQTGVGAVLYPPKVLYKDVLNENLFMSLAYDGDDLWFWAMANLNKTKIAICKNNINRLCYVDGSQEVGLWHENVENFGNDKKLQNLISHYPQLLKKLNKKNYNDMWFNKIFSITKSGDKKHKIITVLGLKFKIKRKRFIQKERIKNLECQMADIRELQKNTEDQLNKVQNKLDNIKNDSEKKFLKIRNLFSELNYANLFHDSTLNSEWLKNKNFSLYGAAANYSFIYTLFKILDNAKPKSILEFGLGQTTKLTSQYAIYSNCKLDVCEHDLEWINIYKKQLPDEKNININHLDLEYFDYDGVRNDRYANLNTITKDRKFDLIIIDGPIGHKKNFPRSNILEVIENNSLDENFIIIIDDTERKGEQMLIKKIKDMLTEKNIDFVYSIREGNKQQSLITSTSFSYIKNL
ncbi:MAG: hypothetical protein E7020_05910 [Alphaproteobacteria bacterium]|nr:hypothetical protein [Alphaproteobacteria bacterium]